MFMRTYACSDVLEWKKSPFIEKVNSRCFCWFPTAILVYQLWTTIWRLHTKFYKGAWNVSANNSETVGHKELRLGQIVYTFVFHNISFSWLLPLDGFQFIFLLRDSENDILHSWRLNLANARISCWTCKAEIFKGTGSQVWLWSKK